NSGSAGAGIDSFRRPLLKNRFQRIQLVTPGESQERLLARGPMRGKGAQDALDGLRSLFRFCIAVNLSPDGPIGAEAAADVDVVTLDGVAVVRDRDSGAEQPDVADVVLSAGIWAAGKVDVHRAVERQPRLAPMGNLLGMALGVGKGETAAGIAGA